MVSSLDSFARYNLGFNFLSKYQVHLRKSIYHPLEEVLNKALCSALTGDQATPLDTTACLTAKGMDLFTAKSRLDHHCKEWAFTRLAV